MSHDAFYSVYEMDEEMGTFIAYYQLIPDLIIFGYNDDLPEKLRSLSDPARKEDLHAQCLPYDTTFKLRDFYCSLLVFSGTEFEENPIMPVMYMIHERKYGEIHDLFWQQVAKFHPWI